MCGVARRRWRARHDVASCSCGWLTSVSPTPSRCCGCCPVVIVKGCRDPGAAPPDRRVAASAWRAEGPVPTGRSGASCCPAELAPAAPAAGACVAGASGHGPTLAPRRDRPPPRRGITPAQPRAATHCPVGPGPGVATGPEYETFYNAHRPHQGIANARPLQSLPEPITDLDHLARLDIRR